MTTEQEKEFLFTLNRIALALDRLASHFSPEVEFKPKRPAILSTAIYNPEEREKQEWLKRQKSDSPKR